MTKRYLITNNNQRRIFLILFVFVFTTTNAFALPLGSATFNHYCPDYGSVDSVIFYKSLTNADIMNNVDRLEGTGDFFPVSTFDPFFMRNLTLNDIGYTFAINESNYEYWDNMTQFVLLDGDQDYIAYNLGWVDPIRQLKWDFSEHYAGNNIDFQGYFISNLLVTIDDLQVLESYYNPGYYDWTVTWTLTVDGHHVPVPEPSALLLFSAGLVGLALYRRKMNKS